MRQKLVGVVERERERGNGNEDTKGKELEEKQNEEAKVRRWSKGEERS